MSEARGVQRIEGRVTAIERAENGQVRALRTDRARTSRPTVSSTARECGAVDRGAVRGAVR